MAAEVDKILPPLSRLCDTRRLLIYLSVSLLAGLHKKLQADLAGNSGKLDLAHLRGELILVVIRISIGIQDRIEGFFTIAR